MEPSEKIYTDLVNIVMNVEFAQGGGWNRSKIGWFWGGMTVQGVLPYYYNKVTTPGRSQIVDRCYYNTMADTDPCRCEYLAVLLLCTFCTLSIYCTLYISLYGIEDECIKLILCHNVTHNDVLFTARRSWRS